MAALLVLRRALFLEDAHVRYVFGIEDFCRKLNGSRTLRSFLHMSIAAGSPDRLPRSAELASVNFPG